MLDKSSVDEAMRNLKESGAVHSGHAAGGSRSVQQASQLASDVKYKAAQKMGAKWRVMSDSEKLKIYLQILASSPAPGNVKNEAKKKLLAKKTKKEETSKSFNKFISEGDAAYDFVLKSLKAKHGDNAVLGTGEKPKDTRSEKSKTKATRKRAASDEKERRFKKRNPAVTSGRYPKDDEKAWAAAREREKSEGVSEGKLVHGPFGPYITGQKLPKEHKEVPLVKVPYENFNSTSRKVSESIKINQATPKSPNCIVMPAKDDISDKSKTKAKTTKTVVTKKQKQLLNQEHVTLEGMSKVAESLGGTVISLTEQGKSNWRGELTSPNVVKKYALSEFGPAGGAITIPAGIALWKLLGGAAVIGGLGSAAYDYNQKMKGKKGIFPNVFGGNKTSNMDNIQWKDTNVNKTNNNVKNNNKIDSVDSVNTQSSGTTIKPQEIGTPVGNVGNLAGAGEAGLGGITIPKKNTDAGKGKVVDIPTTTVNVPALAKATDKVDDKAISKATTAVQSKTKKKVPGLRLPGLPKFNNTHNVGATKNPT